MSKLDEFITKREVINLLCNESCGCNFEKCKHKVDINKGNTFKSDTCEDVRLIINMSHQ